MVHLFFSICVITRGRYECLNGDAIPNLLRCLLSQSTRVRVNALKVSILFCNYAPKPSAACIVIQWDLGFDYHRRGT